VPHTTACLLFKPAPQYAQHKCREARYLTAHSHVLVASLCGATCVTMTVHQLRWCNRAKPCSRTPTLAWLHQLKVRKVESRGKGAAHQGKGPLRLGCQPPTSRHHLVTQKGRKDKGGDERAGQAMPLSTHQGYKHWYWNAHAKPNMPQSTTSPFPGRRRRRRGGGGHSTATYCHVHVGVLCPESPQAPAAAPSLPLQHPA
jgi:hypothetical protein